MPNGALIAMTASLNAWTGRWQCVKCNALVLALFPFLCPAHFVTASATGEQ